MRYMQWIEAPDGRTRIQRHRDTLRSRGMRPVQIWVPDTRTEAFRREAARQCAAANAADGRDDTLAWLESVSVFDLITTVRRSRVGPAPIGRMSDEEVVRLNACMAVYLGIG